MLFLSRVCEVRERNLKCGGRIAKRPVMLLVGPSFLLLPEPSRAKIPTRIPHYIRPPYMVASPLLFVRVFSCIGYVIQN